VNSGSLVFFCRHYSLSTGLCLSVHAFLINAPDRLLGSPSRPGDPHWIHHWPLLVLSIAQHSSFQPPPTFLLLSIHLSHHLFAHLFNVFLFPMKYPESCAGPYSRSGVIRSGLHQHRNQSRSLSRRLSLSRGATDARAVSLLSVTDTPADS